VSKSYQYRIKSDTRKKLNVFQELELSLHIRSGLVNLTKISLYAHDLSANPQVNVTNNSVILQGGNFHGQHPE
jgi:hypothetical protein